MSKELVLRDANVALMPAAQYIRMSTEHQRYSPDNQKAAIASFAAARGFEIVDTYEDWGKSGLTLSKRPGLKKLLSDVLAGNIAFKTILVLDVSRWGRFQDTDQAAHYEYMCREAGVQLHYCTEPFENDGGALASIVKHMKRVMAAEYSRELSVRVSRAQRQQAQLGFKQGGRAPYGTRRQVIDETGKRLMILKTGQRKALNTDKVVFVPGPAREAKVVLEIFRDYAENGLGHTEIAKRLNREKRKHPTGRPWTPHIVYGMLKNEIYIGTFVFGKRLNNLGSIIWFGSENWIRVPIFRPIVPVELFEAAAQRLADEAQSRKPQSDEDLIAGLKRLLAEKGRLSYCLVQACPYLPAPSVFGRRFGGIRGAFRAAGYDRCPYSKLNTEGIPVTDAELLADLQRIYSQRGSLRAKDLEEDAAAHPKSFYMRRFGGLRNAIRLAGLPIPPRSAQEAAAETRQKERFEDQRPKKVARVFNDDGSRMTNAQIVSALKLLLAKNGYLSRQIIDADPSVPTSNMVTARFGSMYEAYALVGYHTTQAEINRAVRERMAAAEQDVAHGPSA